MVILVIQIANARVFAFGAVSENTRVEWFVETACFGDCVVAPYLLGNRGTVFVKFSTDFFEGILVFQAVLYFIAVMQRQMFMISHALNSINRFIIL